MFGGELTDLDAWTFSLLTEPTLEAVHLKGENARQTYRQDGWIIWESKVENTRHYALFNLADEDRFIPEHLHDLFPPGQKLAAHDCLVI